MRKKHIIYILVFFAILIGILTIDSYGFSEGDTVKCKVKSYHYYWYEYIEPQGGSIHEYRRISSEDYFKAGTVVTYVKNMGVDGICSVRRNGSEYLIKEVNLESYTSGEVGARDRAAQEVYNEYKNQDFTKLDSILLKTASDKCILAASQTTDQELKIKLNALIEKIADEARSRNMEVSEDGVIRRRSFYNRMGKRC